MDLAARLVMANPDRDDPLAAECIVMIDEIDLHLHPTWQQKIIPDLMRTFPCGQFIITTHSPEVVTSVPKEAVKILKNNSIRNCDSPTFGARASDVVRQVMGLHSLRAPNEVAQSFESMFEAIDQENVGRAKTLLGELKAWDPHRYDTDVTKAEMLIRRLERAKSS
jgi:predicted ATP-binding protein involved in virulence